MPTIIEIHDLFASELAVYARLTEAQLRNRRHPEQGFFIAESPKVIGYALDAGLEPVSLLMEKKQLSGAAAPILARLSEALPVYTGEREVLAALTGYALTRGVLCALRRPAPADSEALLRASRRVALLVGIVDPTNVGAIFRSAAALGMDGVLISPDCCDPLHRRAVRVSMGTVFQIPWAVLEDWEALSRQGFQTAAMALTDRSLSIDDPRLTQAERLALVLGTEGNGLPQTLIDRCDFTVKIPMSHGVDSLNVGAAAAVAFWVAGKR